MRSRLCAPGCRKRKLLPQTAARTPSLHLYCINVNIIDIFHILLNRQAYWWPGVNITAINYPIGLEGPAALSVAPEPANLNEYRSPSLHLEAIAF